MTAVWTLLRIRPAVDDGRPVLGVIRGRTIDSLAAVWTVLHAFVARLESTSTGGYRHWIGDLAVRLLRSSASPGGPPLARGLPSFFSPAAQPRPCRSRTSQWSTAGRPSPAPSVEPTWRTWAPTSSRSNAPAARSTERTAAALGRDRFEDRRLRRQRTLEPRVPRSRRVRRLTAEDDHRQERAADAPRTGAVSVVSARRGPLPQSAVLWRPLANLVQTRTTPWCL